MTDISAIVQINIEKYRKALDEGMPYDYANQYEFLRGVMRHKDKKTGHLKLKNQIIRDNDNPTQELKRLLYSVTKKSCDRLPDLYRRACESYKQVIEKNPKIIKIKNSKRYTLHQEEEFKNKYIEISQRYPFIPEIKSPRQVCISRGDDIHCSIEYVFLEPINIRKNEFRGHRFIEGFSVGKEEKEETKGLFEEKIKEFINK